MLDQDEEKLAIKGLKEGIVYDKAVSVFSDEGEEEFSGDYNILDVYIGEANFD